jgi:hypothetical protein
MKATHEHFTIKIGFRDARNAFGTARRTGAVLSAREDFFQEHFKPSYHCSTCISNMCQGLILDGADLVAGVLMATLFFPQKIEVRKNCQKNSTYIG